MIPAKLHSTLPATFRDDPWKSVKEIIAKWKEKTKDAITEEDKTQFTQKLDDLIKYLNPITGDEDSTRLENPLGKETYAAFLDILIVFGSTLPIPLDDKIASELQNRKKKEQEKREKLRIAIINGVDECISLGSKPLEELTPAVQKQFLETWLELRKNLKAYFNGDDKIWNLEKLIEKDKYKALHAVLEKFQNISEIVKLTDEIIKKWSNRKKIQIPENLWRDLWDMLLKVKKLLKQLNKNSKDFSELEYFLTKPKVHQIYTIIATLESSKKQAKAKDSLLDSKQTESGGWKVVREGKVRAVAYAEKSTASLKSLADTVGLVYSEMNQWLKLDKDGNYTVPNIWIAADLMRGGSLWDRLVLNHGGTIGTFVGTDILTSGFKVLKPKTPSELETTISAYKGDIWGLVIFAHGNPWGGISPNTLPSSLSDFVLT